jgi:hypothetical protein
MTASSADKSALSALPPTPFDYLETRAPFRAVFLSAHLPDAATPSLIGEDWGARRYFRIKAKGKSYVLMESVPDHHVLSAPGHKIADFIRIAEALRHAGLHAPAVIAAQPEEGYVLLEDMGDVSFYAAIQNGESEQSLYLLATDVLRHFETSFSSNTLNLPNYHDTYVHTARRRVIDWYMPAQRQVVNGDGVADEYLAIWDTIEKTLPSVPTGFMHVDYHAQNLMWLPYENGLKRCGILDFQGAMWGPLPYDLVNLLEDIRRDVPDDIRAVMIGHRTAGMNAADKEAFMAWYQVLALQFHCRVIGQIIRLALVQGKPKHLQNMPRLQGYMKRELDYPAMAPLKAFFTQQGVTFDAPPVIDPIGLKKLIRSDAF